MKTSLRAPNVLAAALGVWLVVAAFAWPHSNGQRATEWVVGALVFASSLGASRLAGARYLTMLLAAWLFIAAFTVTGTSAFARWNDVVVAVLLFVAMAWRERADDTTGARHA
jgi:hypothetical protein